MDNLAAYTAIPYEGQVTWQTEPDNLAVVARLLGLDPVPLDGARVLEIGCADGGNLVPMAERHPGASFVGLDLTPALLERAAAYADAAGVRNVRWVQADIADPELDLGPFDYIVVHGVFSWISDDTRAAMLRRIAEWLSPRGLATISYNVWPGWSLRAPMRGMLTWHADRAAAPEDRLRRARGLAGWLSSLPKNNRLLGRAMRGELAQVEDMPDWYLFHEHLAQDNQPMWFHEFARMAATAQLAYVGDADFADMVPVDLPAEVQDGLEALAYDRVSYEQYLDFARERAFRRSILAPAATAADYAVSSERLTGLHVGARIFLPSDWDEDSDEPQTLTTWPMGVQPSSPEGTVGIQARDADDKRMWGRIAAAWPGTVPVDDATAGLSQVQSRRQQLLFAYLQHGLRLFASPRRSGRAGERPKVRACARAEAGLERRWVTTAWHRMVQASDHERALMRALTGEHSREDLVRDLFRSFSRGSLPLPEDLGDVEEAQVRRWLDRRLSALENALLLEES